jgi:uncharacterized protein YndB with AHSA1/START domain
VINHDLKLEISEKFDSFVAEVWDALTDKESVKKYFFGTELNTDWKVGSPIIFRGNWEGQSYEDKGKILEAEKEKLIKYTYLSSFSGLPDLKEKYSTITYQLQPEGQGTMLTVVRQGFRDEKAHNDSKEGWRIVLKNLKKLLSEKQNESKSSS